MSISSALLISLAGRLLSRWRDRLGGVDGVVLPEEIDLAAYIKDLALKSNRLGTDLLQKLESAGSVSNPLVLLVESTVENLNRVLGEHSISGLMIQNILTKRIAERINSLSCCDGEVAEPPTATTADFRKPGAWEGIELVDFFLYFVESFPPDVPNVNQAIEKAWRHWKNAARVLARRVDAPEKANVIIRARHFPDGRNGVLAQAHEGPPLGRKLVLEMDLHEDWSIDPRFEVILTHEIGHILGLFKDSGGHNPSPGHLMSEFVQMTITGPSDEDQAEALRLYGPRLATV